MLLAARGIAAPMSRSKSRARSLLVLRSFPRIFEEKADCSQSKQEVDRLQTLACLTKRDFSPKWLTFYTK